MLRKKEQRMDKGLCVPDSATGFGRREQGRDTGSAAWLEAGKWLWATASVPHHVNLSLAAGST